MTSSPSTAVPLGTPLYLQVKDAVLAALAQGEWKQGDAIPSEKMLSERFGVSIGTLRKAIDELAAENILTRHQGRGTYVSEHTRNPHFFKFFRIQRNDGHKAYPTTRLVRFKRVRANAAVREVLGLPAGSHVFEFLNVLALNGDVVLADTIALPEALFSGMTDADLRDRSSTLYRFYQERFGVNVIATDERVRTCRAEAPFTELLDVPEGEPLLEIRRVAFSYHGQPVEWRVSRVNTARYDYLGQEPGAMVGKAG